MLARFLDLLFPPRSDEERVRELSEESFLRLLEPRLVEATTPATHALLPFADSRVRATIHEAKYHGSERAFALLSAALGEYLANLAEEQDLRGARLLPIPLGARRRAERGFNQAEEVAKRVSKTSGIPLASDLLVRTRETASQVSLPRHARKQNMKSAFACSAELDERSRAAVYILLDDVVTTGATTQAALGALKAAGAANLTPIALAH